jgi:glycosyltransferase involved in cell wall biosynthesis
MHFHSESKEKIGLIVREVATQWVSCAHINEGLKLAYENASNVQVFELYTKNSHEIVNRIIDSQINCLVFLDHQVRPLEILRNNDLIRAIKTRGIRVIFHIYGCFVDRLVEFHTLLALLEDQDVHFVAASPKQKLLAEYSFILPEGSVHCIPFPVKEVQAEIYPKQSDLRNLLGLPAQGRIFLYTGRISTYKNVELLMSLMAELRKSNKDLFFVYLGQFDQFDSFLANDKISNQAIINAKILNHIDPNSEWCFYRAHVPERELTNFYQAADAFVSLSTCRGEDFGMSVLEASSYGLPSFLTDWGGYSGFGALSQTYLAPVSFEKDDINISTEGLFKMISSFSSSTFEEKKEKNKQVLSMFGQKETTIRIKELLACKKANPIGVKKDLLIERHFLKKAKSWEIFMKMKGLYEFYAS